MNTIRMTELAVGVLLFTAQSAAAQYLFFSPNGSCSSDGTGCWAAYQTYYVFLKAPEVPGAAGARFRLESQVFGPEDFAAVTPAPGVTIEGGDLFSGIELSWPPGSYTNDTLLTISIALNPPDDNGWIVGYTRDIELDWAGGSDPIALEDFLFDCSHCSSWDRWIVWNHADTVAAPAGAQSSVDIECVGYSTGGFSGTNFDVDDEMGWVTNCTNCGVAFLCSPCPWDVTHVGIHLDIPAEVPDGAVSRVRILPTSALGDSTAFYVRAASPTPVEKTSWGSLKAIFEQNADPRF